MTLTFNHESGNLMATHGLVLTLDFYCYYYYSCYTQQNVDLEGRGPGCIRVHCSR